MRRTIIIIGVAVGVVIIVVGIFAVYRGSNNGTLSGAAGTEQDPSKVSGGIPAADIPSGDTITIGTSHGSVTTKNFYKNAIGFIEESNLVIMKSPTYEIDYSSSNSSFAITIVQGPFDSTRLSAENDFLGILGINKSDACKLSVSIIVPASLNISGAGKIYPLNFCGTSL